MATAFCRANSTHPFRTSILPLVDIIAAMTCSVSDDDLIIKSDVFDVYCAMRLLEVNAPLSKEESVNVDKFMSTIFFRSQCHVK